jgi:hypothetical protein
MSNATAKAGCAPGAYYRKLVSTVDTWTRIEATMTLPTVTFDPSRRSPDGKPLDNASVYLGGRSSGGEIDCGLSWEVVRQPDGSVSTDRKAFRPFWRNKQWHTAPAKPELYFMPGDVVRIRVETTKVDQLTMTIERLEDSSRHDLFAIDFDAPGFGPTMRQELKVVSAIDQSGNEGQPVQPTKTSVEGLLLGVTLAPGSDSPVGAPSWTELRCPDAKYFDVLRLDDGRERIGISGEPSD